MIHFFISIILSFLSCALFGQSDITGKWVTYDDHSGRKKSVVEIIEKEGEIYGYVVDLYRLPNEDHDPICNLCEDDRLNEKVRGMEIIRALKPKGAIWQNGEILDPENGKTYDCKIWREADKLKVRGYIAFFFRTQEWLPYSN